MKSVNSQHYSYVIRKLVLNGISNYPAIKFTKNNYLPTFNVMKTSFSENLFDAKKRITLYIAKHSYVLYNRVKDILLTLHIVREKHILKGEATKKSVISY